MASASMPPEPVPTTPEAPEKLKPALRIPANVRLFALLTMAMLALFELLRFALIFGVRTPEDASWAQLRQSFLIGARFDLSTACFLLAPVMILCYIPWTSPWRGPRTRGLILWIVTLVFAVAGFLLAAEIAFFLEFQTRYNQLAIRYLDQPATVGKMLWYDYPIIRYLLALVAVTAIINLLLRFGLRWVGRIKTPGPRPGLLVEAVGAIVVLAGVIIGIRGGVQSEPLRWGDAYRADNEFVSQMSLNGLWSLGQAIRESFDRGGESEGWTKQFAQADARLATRAMVVTPGEQLLDPGGRSVLRQGNVGSSVVLKSADGKPLNVVVVMMESFSGRFCGAVGAPRTFTPAFDALSKDGVLFDHCFSAGSHTHQGIFATLLGFPNLPGYETLMQSGVGNQPFLSLPQILQNRGYRTYFLYNGNFQWDNMRGFFRKQGVDTFIGGDEMTPDARFLDHVWGVSDGDLFDRANREFEEAAKKGPFMAAIMTLSNHVPFEVPPVPGAAPITDMGELNKRLEAMRYADWAVGHFIEEAKKLSYFKNTLFVFVGDHGFAVKPTLTEVNLLYHHVPLLFYAPGLSDQHRVDHRAAVQMNILPSVLGLLGLTDAPQASWARSLFNDSFPDDNFAIFKMSGGGKAMAIARGDHLLVFDHPKAEPQLMTYTLWPPAVTPIDDPAMKKKMARELKAYVESALLDLIEHKAGPAAEPAKK